MDVSAGETGHLFAVHGRIESLIHDAALVPVGQEYAFSPAWTDLVGERPPVPLAWTERGYGRVRPAPDRVWAVSIGGRSGDTYARILDRVAGALARIDLRRDARKPVRGKGALPLVAVPVIGIGLGGHSEDRGTVLRMLVEHLIREAQRLRLDIALVTPEPAVYAAAQYARRKLTPPLPGRLESVAEDLARHARSGHLALLLGAGVSAAAGLPNWTDLISRLASESGVPDPDPGSGLTPTDQAELIERVDPKGFQRRVATIIGNDQRPSLPHALLAGLDCHEVVTTNYDLLYERAVAATGRDIAGVMPWSSAHGADRWILKLHGDVKHPKGIVLTRRHMVRYDAANRPSAAILQSLLLTKRLLAVGVSMTDDNVIRLAHEVDAYRHEHQDDPTDTFGTVLDAGGHELRRQLWKGQLDWINIPDQMGCPGPRGVELFLDRIAFHASRDSSWLLDERFEGLLNDREDREIAQQVRELYRDLPSRDGSKWAPLARQLEQLGVKGSATSTRPPSERPQ